MYQHFLPDHEQYELSDADNIILATDNIVKTSEFNTIINEQNQRLKISESLYSTAIEELEDIRNINISLMDKNTKLLKALAATNKFDSANYQHKSFNNIPTKEIDKPIPVAVKSFHSDTNRYDTTNQLNFYISTDVRFVLSPAATVREHTHNLKKWLTSELSYLLKEYASSLGTQSKINSQETMPNKLSCALDNKQLNYKEFILIKPTLIANQYWWHKLKIDLINCQNATSQTIIFDDFSPMRTYVLNTKLWNNDATRKNLQKLLYASIKKINNSHYDNI